MPTIVRMVILTATGEFKFGGFYTPVVPDANHSIVLINTGVVPDIRFQRWSGSAVVNRTPTELAAYDTTQVTVRFTAISRQKDQLANCAQIVRSRNVNAWNAMTLIEKRNATLAEADVWVTIRQFIEDNL